MKQVEIYFMKNSFHAGWAFKNLYGFWWFLKIKGMYKFFCKIRGIYYCLLLNDSREKKMIIILFLILKIFKGKIIEVKIIIYVFFSF